MKWIPILLTASAVNCAVVFSQTEGLDIGNRAPFISLPDLQGDTVALSSFRGKLVLIDFWATWCAPCVKEQPELAALYGKYKNSHFKNGKGFDIYGVSLDSEKSSWENTIKRLNITWTQVSDLKFWSSPVAALYDIQELPFNVLIDGRGVIIAKNLHGEALRQFIHNLVSQE